MRGAAERRREVPSPRLPSGQTHADRHNGRRRRRRRDVFELETLRGGRREAEGSRASQMKVLPRSFLDLRLLLIFQQSSLAIALFFEVVALRLGGQRSPQAVKESQRGDQVGTGPCGGKVGAEREIEPHIKAILDNPSYLTTCESLC
ncbi:hypothetical protein EYF80_024919 [Liparis tanakae]|uniref:Uncharacterized protein n=1 Tax=Liparis tanakae TaxID=230148 RepID=A0A4Z2HG24_9TELE|nr:hypothetical protein EYF80_024919 [Liparis tanakae]